MEATEVPDEWEQVKSEWDKTNQLGYLAVEQAAKVGQMLINLKGDTKPGKFQEEVKRAALFEYRTAANLMALAKNKDLLEREKPESQREALKLIREANPKPKKKTASVSAPKASTVPDENETVLRLDQTEFKLILECLQTEAVPVELKDNFKKALDIIRRAKK